MNTKSILQSSYENLFSRQGSELSPQWRSAIEMDKDGFYKNMAGLEGASKRLATAQMGREMILQKQKAEEEDRLQAQRARQEERLTRLRAGLGMK